MKHLETISHAEQKLCWPDTSCSHYSKSGPTVLAPIYVNCLVGPDHVFCGLQNIYSIMRNKIPTGVL